jgi:hypothetical protein
VLQHGADDGRSPDGFDYFLEISLAREFLEDWKASLGAEPSIIQACARLIQYAENDA